MKIGTNLKFNIYGTYVEGIFVKAIDNKIIIKTTKDNVFKEGENQTIHKNFLIKEN